MEIMQDAGMDALYGRNIAQTELKVLQFLLSASALGKMRSHSQYSYTHCQAELVHWMYTHLFI
jgi:hypothetical protein